MLKSIADFFTAIEDNDREELTGDQIQTAMATLLFHAIAVDGVADETERKRLHALLAEHFEIDDSQVRELLKDAEKQEKEAVDIYRFTSVLKDRLSFEEKRKIIKMMWKLVYADGELAAVEDNLLWRTAELLAVPARDRMELKRMVRDNSR